MEQGRRRSVGLSAGGLKGTKRTDRSSLQEQKEKEVSFLAKATPVEVRGLTWSMSSQTRVSVHRSSRLPCRMDGR